MKRVSLIFLIVSLLLAALWSIARQPAAAAPVALPAGGAIQTQANRSRSDESPQTIYTTAAAKDSYVDQETPSTNYGDAVNLWIARDSEGNEEHTLFYFDTGALPSNINVISATIDVYSIINRQPAQPAAGLFVQPEAIVNSWTEYGVTWNNRPPSTYLSDPAVEYQQGWLTFDVTNIAQAWIDGTVPNEGIKLVPQSGQTGWAFFFDRSNGSTGPHLTISYEAAPPPCTALSSVTVDGPTLGQTGSDYTFGATVSPVDATEPYTYTWSATGQSGSSDSTVTYNWSTAGQKAVNLTVENCGGSVSDSHTLTIEEPLPECETPLADLALQGPTSGGAGFTYTYSAVASPTDADTPITFTWQATDQSQQQSSGSEYTSDVAWSWSTIGSKQISVTAENCGASFIRNLTVDIVSLYTLPDLSPGTPWYDALKGAVGYIIHNNGQNDAPSGHSVGLYEHTLHLDSATVTETIPGGGLRAGRFSDAWSACAGDDSLLTIVVDENNVVDEGSENNNDYSEYWPCDLRAPTIVDGPAVVEKSATTARVDWTADEVTDGWLEYGQTGYAPSTMESAEAVTDHSVTLSGLQPATTYRIRAFVEDATGNTTNSDWFYFETNTPGVDPPAFLALGTKYLADHDYDTYILSAELDDVTYVDRVEFYLDGTHMGTDYSPYGRTFGVYLSPPESGYDPQTFFGQAHALEAHAFTIAGVSITDSRSWQPDPRPAPITLQFWDPDSGEEIEIDGDQAPAGTTVDARVFAVETDWKCSWGGSVPNTVGLLPVACGEVNPRPVEQLRLRLDGFTQDVVNPVPDLDYTFTVDVSNRGLGDHTLEASATGSDDTITALERTFELVRGDPDFRYERHVTRQDNVFEISFTVINEGNAAARVETIRDTLYGFQVIHRDFLPGLTAETTSPGVEAWYTVRTDNTRYDSTVVEVDLSSAAGDYVRVAPGESFTVTYHAVPILYRTPLDVYRIGAKAGAIFHFISYREDFDGAGLWTDDFYAVRNAVDDAELGGLVTLHQAVMAAVAEADYIIVTSPYGLRVNASNANWSGADPEEDRERLYSDMAELAREAHGVIGYYVDSHGFVLDDLLEPGGYWHDSLHPNFRQTLQGYVLIVGEHEVVPVRGAGYDVPWSDLRYASTGGDARPELVLGRLIGDNVATLRQPLDAAIRYHKGLPVYDHSHALLYAGRGDGEGAFWDAIKSISSRLPGSTDVTRIRSKSVAASQAEGAFLNNSTDRDIIVYRGHGYVEGEGFAISDAADVDTDDINGLGGFGNARPFMFALACSAGDYEEDDDYGIAEASLREGAAVFIGATNLSHRYRNNEAARWFFNRFNADRSVGDTFADLLRDKFHEWSAGDEVTNSTEWGRWAYQYQLYGDPKFGRLTSGAQQRQSTVSTELQGSNTLDIILGELEVADDGAWHLASIPEGGYLQGAGQYVVPVQRVIAHYPAGTRVQDVQLSVRSGLVVTTGLNIPISYFRQDDNGVLEQYYGAPSSSVENPNTGWEPALEQPFTWRVAENADGSSDLLLVIYPFSYDPATTDARYYREWTFNVETITSNVTAGPLETGANRYALGDTVTATMTVQNSGGAQDVLVSTVVRDLRGVAVAGLRLRTLHDLQGKATFSSQWESDGIEPGEYVLEVTLLNSQGQELDKQREPFTLGLVQAEGVRLASGTYPSTGAGVPLSLTVRNSGDTAISGTLHLRVENVDTGEIAATFSQDASHFQPGSDVQLNVVWDDGAVPEGGYRAVGYLRYGGTISTPLVRRLGQVIHLPLILQAP